MKIDEIKKLKPDFFSKKMNSLYICSGGFEERVKSVVKIIEENHKNKFVFQQSAILKYNVQQEDNEQNIVYLNKRLSNCSIKLDEILINVDNISETKQNLSSFLRTVNISKIDQVLIDITGMSNFLIIQIIFEVNRLFRDQEIYILYTEAKQYFPTAEEVDQILETYKDNEESSIQKRSELGISEVGAKRIFILPDFNGNFKEDLPICLIYLVGYEPLRSKGMIEQYQPDLIIVCYSKSPHKKFEFRTGLSVKLHKGEQVFTKNRIIEEKGLSTFNIVGIVDKLEKLLTSSINNSILYENYNIAISPQCSKLQAVASYLFCSKHPEIQLVFCIPGKFKPSRYSSGIGNSWVYNLVR